MSSSKLSQQLLSMSDQTKYNKRAIYFIGGTDSAIPSKGSGIKSFNRTNKILSAIL